MIYVPSICLVELTYLVEKRRLPCILRDQLVQTLDDPASPCAAPLDCTVADALETVKRSEVPDLPDADCGRHRLGIASATDQP